MALTPRSGFSASTSGPNTVDNDLPNTQTDILNNMPFITDGALNKYAIDSSAYPNTTRQLVGFIKGKRVLVTYYRQMRQGGSNIRTNIADYPTTRGVLNNEYQKILNLEITLTKGFEFTANPENASGSVEGDAVFYPNMNPSVGDIFTTGMGDGRIGVFQIAGVNAGTWRDDRIYTVRFVLQSFLDNSDSDPIEGSVTMVSVFSKENYLAKTAALLSEETYLQLEKIKVIRGTLIRHYHQLFWNRELFSFVRPDSAYDPWAVQFMSNKITMDDIPVRPKNLLGYHPDIYRSTIWGRLEDRFNTTLNMLSARSLLLPVKQTRLSTFVTELYGRLVVTPVGPLFETDVIKPSILSLEQSTAITDTNGVIITDPVSTDGLPPDGSPYIFSDMFYKASYENMSGIEKLIYTAIVNRTAGSLTTLIETYLSKVYDTSVMDQYYLIPMYIHLIDMALQSQYREIDAPSMGYASTGGN